MMIWSDWNRHLRENHLFEKSRARYPSILDVENIPCAMCPHASLYAPHSWHVRILAVVYPIWDTLLDMAPCWRHPGEPSHGSGCHLWTAARTRPLAGNVCEYRALGAPSSIRQGTQNRYKRLALDVFGCLALQIWRGESPRGERLGDEPYSHDNHARRSHPCFHYSSRRLRPASELHRGTQEHSVVGDRLLLRLLLLLHLHLLDLEDVAVECNFPDVSHCSW